MNNDVNTYNAMMLWGELNVLMEKCNSKQRTI